jgi:SAM-dependent methyltransferase
MTIRFNLPPRNTVHPVDGDDPLPYYYWPFAGWFYRERLNRLLALFAGRMPGRVLEAACGSGILQPSLGEAADFLAALDLHASGGAVNTLRARHGLPPGFVRGDAFRLPFASETFDHVVCASMLEHLTDPGAAIDEMLRVIRPGGALLAGFPARNRGMDSFFRLLGFDPAAIHPSSHFDILAAIRQRRDDVLIETFPAWTPLRLTLYCCCRIVK